MNLVERLRKYELSAGEWTAEEAADLIEKQAAELASAGAEIERLSSSCNFVGEANEKLGARVIVAEKQLAAEQAKNAGLREAILTQAPFDSELEKPLIEAISAPSDTSALEALIAKAGEKMRDLAVAKSTAGERKLTKTGKSIAASIRALPGVTLEDLK